ncbi:hypothetical protein [Streptomyces sp. NPDC058326]|uniref:hypothetical protein n=1 Tax=Streptomyces sp. NPDC058326 TaxID=3346447 RepID=UPI0036F03753
MTRSENEVDQIVFRWDSENLSGSTGFGPVAWSGPRDEAENLFRISGPVLRASGEETRPALIRLQRRADVMLIRRVPFTDAGGGTSVLCHALVGSPALLDPSVCLGLHAWNWEGADLDAAEARGRLPVIPEEVLVPATGRGQGELDRTLPYVAEELTGAVAELLRHPEERFTVLDEHGDTACPVLWGLHSMFGTLTDRRWTFATHDTAELPALRYVFVGRWSGAASHNTERRRVDPRERTGDRAEEAADRLVRHHLRGVAEGEGREYAVGSALHAASAARRGPLLETVTRALQALDGDADAPAPPGPRPARALQVLDGDDGAQAPRPAGRRWGRTPGGRTAEDPPPSGRPVGQVPPPAPGVLRGADRPGPSERPDLWFRQDPPPDDRNLPGTGELRPTPYGPETEAPEHIPETLHLPTVPDGDDGSAPDRHRPAFPDPASPSAPDRDHRAFPDSARPPAPDRDHRAFPDSARPTAPDRDHRAVPEARSYPPAPDPRPRAVPEARSYPPAPADPAHPDDPLMPRSSEPGDRSASPAGDGSPSGSGTRAPEGRLGPPAPGAPRPGADPYPRPVLPLVAPVWTGPGAGEGRSWARARGGREREAETGLVHKLPIARTVEEARELVERGGSRELLGALRRPQAYVVLTLLLRETARRLPSWEHPLRRELCEVALEQEYWAVAPPGGEADPSDPPEEQRAANAAELHRWAVSPLLDRGDAPVGTVAELLSRLRTSPAPSAREAFWLIVDGERPGLPEAVWLTLLKEAYGVPRTASRPGGAVSRPSGHPVDPGNGYTRRFLRRAAVLLGGLVAAIVLIAAWGWLT